MVAPARDSDSRFDAALGNGAPYDVAEVSAALRREGVHGVDASDLVRSLYASDASVYRVLPLLVAIPRHVDELEAIVSVCRKLRVPLTMRGAGTSIAGNAVGRGVVVDVSRHLNRVLEVDPEAGTALVEPGIIQSQLHAVTGKYKLRFGPDPSTIDRATIAGMIGNNACGARALAYGHTAANLLGLDAITGTGERLRVGALAQPSVPAKLLADLTAVVTGGAEVIRAQFGRFSRQNSGYALEYLLPKDGKSAVDGNGILKLLAGSEGTLAVTTAALVRLIKEPKERIVVALGYPSMPEAADAVPALLAHSPTACEGLDRRIVDQVKAGGKSVPELPAGTGWLLVELAGDSMPELRDRAAALIADAGALAATVVEDRKLAAALWKVRKDGAGLSSRTPAGDPAWAGWEDSAVPAHRLGGYLRDLDNLFDQFGLTGAPYGHFGDGCLHIRIDFPFAPGTGSAVFHDFMIEAAKLALVRGGSLSGEHGDGRARSELLSLMYSPEALDLMAKVKAAFDPDDVLNPGVLVRPDPLDADIRAVETRRVTRADGATLGFAYRADGGDLSRALHRCIGMANCRAGVKPHEIVCPSYAATKEEKDSTRGRSRVLQDAVSGHLEGGFRSPAVQEALDQCLSCKSCKSGCPTGVDMAAFKSEALYQKYRRRIRPRSHYTLGWLPRWTRLIGSVPGLSRVANFVLQAKALHPFVAWVAGIDKRRSLPAFAPQTFRRWWSKRGGSAPAAVAGDVVLFVDSFTDTLAPQVGRATVTVLEAAGYRVRLSEPVCCGLTWITTGQLDAAKRRLSKAVRVLAAEVRQGAVIVGMEPSCTAVLRSDALELLEGEDLEAARDVAGALRTVAELLAATPGWTPPDLSGVTAIAQPHCHHRAVLGWDTDEKLLTAAGAKVQRLGGCCGLAGNFGLERGHHEISVAVAENELLPALRQAGESDVVLADGLSCRTQIASLDGHSTQHLAELLADQLPE